MAHPPLIAGNWKMHGLAAEAEALAQAVVQGTRSAQARVVLCPPFTLLSAVAAQLKGSAVRLGGQDCHHEASGAYTGDIAAPMLKDAGCAYVILGHSERRQHHAETSQQVARKAAAAHQAGLITILCVGETEAERQAGRTLEVVGEQLRLSLPPSAAAQNTVIAYEPVWAIGTGKVATAVDIGEVHGFLQNRLEAHAAFGGTAPAILYGGSVKPGNAAEILRITAVGGLLVGGASLKAQDFLGIVGATA